MNKWNAIFFNVIASNGAISYRNLLRIGFFTDELFCLSGRLVVIGFLRRINSTVMKIWLFKPENSKKIYILVKKIDIGSSNNMFAFAWKAITFITIGLRPVDGSNRNQPLPEGQNFLNYKRLIKKLITKLLSNIKVKTKISIFACETIFFKITSKNREIKTTVKKFFAWKAITFITIGLWPVDGNNRNQPLPERQNFLNCQLPHEVIGR